MERKRINRLKVVLAEKGMTNKQLSEILDKDPAVISKWVTNAAQPNVEMFIQLSKILGVSVDDLLCILTNPSCREGWVYVVWMRTLRCYLRGDVVKAIY